MLDFANATLDELLAPEGHDCACGRHHRTGLKCLVLKENALDELPALLKRMGIHRPFLVSDTNTEQAAGARVAALLKPAERERFVFSTPDGALEPDERAVGALCMAFPTECDAVIAVGSGVLNDCCKVFAHAVGRPSVVVATAPSMDGYASDNASMIQNRVKTSLYVPCPIAIVADTGVLARAPERMLKAGLGDMLAKYISICEWRISHLVTGEYYCENIASLMRASLATIRASADGLLQRRHDAVESVARGLVMSGVAMGFAQISRPASGLEHYFSHLWEMWALQGEAPAALHGEQVGVGTCLTLGLYDHIRTLQPSREKAQRMMDAFSQEDWEQRMKQLFGEATAREVITLEERAHKNDPKAHAQRMDALLTHWDEVQQIIREELPPTEEILALCRRLGVASSPEELGMTHQQTVDAFLGSREIRQKYLTSSMLWDLGELNDFCAYLPECRISKR